jgi:hypothetical protein
MRILTLALTVIAAAALGACATPNEAGQTAEAPKPAEGLICSQERPIGSNIAVTRCRTSEQIQREREAASNALSGPNRGNAPGPTKPGG